MKLCDKIYTCRTQTKLSQEELAEQLGVSRQAVSRWECGDNIPEPAKLLLLARLFGVTTDWLLDDSCEMPRDTEKKEEPKQPWMDTVMENCKSLVDRFGRILDEDKPGDTEKATAADPAPTEETPSAEEDASHADENTNTPPEDFLRRLVARFGWPSGLYLAGIGILLTLLGSLARQVIVIVGSLMIIGGLSLSAVLLIRRSNSKKEK
ncbi:MAG: helix-turn-helix domain-containing protein [Clostridia bacterium]|nr:helix-turn-helix domain-containing protein [Clostridia bacterium]